jgi:hypothetical protein
MRSILTILRLLCAACYDSHQQRPLKFYSILLLAKMPSIPFIMPDLQATLANAAALRFFNVVRCLRMKCSISLDASGPAGSVNRPA